MTAFSDLLESALNRNAPANGEGVVSVLIGGPDRAFNARIGERITAAIRQVIAEEGGALEGEEPATDNPLLRALREAIGPPQTAQRPWDFPPVPGGSATISWRDVSARPKAGPEPEKPTPAEAAQADDAEGRNVYLVFREAVGGETEFCYELIARERDRLRREWKEEAHNPDFVGEYWQAGGRPLLVRFADIHHIN